MTTLEHLEQWRSAGAITEPQHAAISAIVRRERFSLFVELNALLYAGVLLFAYGLGATVYARFADLGDVTVVLGLTAIVAGCLWYCLRRGVPYSHGAVPSPTFAFDYILYLGCLAFGVELGFLEFRFHVLRERWDLYVLVAAVVYFLLAYRFDNRFVLSMALSALGAWFGLRFSKFGTQLARDLRLEALVYAAIVAAGGWRASENGWKRHFLDTYLHVAVNAALGALVSGVFAGDARWLWLLALLGFSAVVIERGVSRRRFAFVAYGAMYGYIGSSAEMMRHVSSAISMATYWVVSAAAMVIALAVLSRRFGREE